MPTDQITKASNLPDVTTADDIVVLQTDGGLKKLGRQAHANLAAQLVATAPIANMLLTNGGGALVYASTAAMNADLVPAAGAMAWVIAAGTVSVYGKVGATGTGSWTLRGSFSVGGEVTEVELAAAVDAARAQLTTLGAAQSRPAIAPEFYSQAATGRAKDMAPLAIGAAETLAGEKAWVINNAGGPSIDIVTRQDWPVELDQIYSMRFAVRRKTDPTDVLTIKFFLFWLDVDLNAINGTEVYSANVRVADGLIERTVTFSRNLAAQWTGPSNIRYVRGLIRIFGANGATGVMAMERRQLDQLLYADLVTRGNQIKAEVGIELAAFETSIMADIDERIDNAPGIGSATERPGDARKMFSSSATGPAAGRTPIVQGTVEVTDGGSALVIAGGTAAYVDVAARQDWAIEPGRVYAARFGARRTENSLDPLNDAIQHFIVWLDKNKALISTATVSSAAQLVSEGLVYRQATFSRDLSADFTAPSNARYVSLMTRVHGASGKTAIEVIDRWVSNGLPGTKGDTGDVTLAATTARNEAVQGALDADAARVLSQAAADRVADLCGVRPSASPYFSVTTVDHASVIEIFAVPHTSDKVSLWNTGTSKWEMLDVSPLPLKLTVTEDVTLASSTAIAGVTQAGDIIAGMLVSGTGIPANTKVTSVVGSTVNIDNAATVSATSRVSFRLQANTTYDIGLAKIGGVARMVILQAFVDRFQRAVSYALQDGVKVLASNRARRYFGTFRTTAEPGLTQDTAMRRWIYSEYNQVPRPMFLQAGPESWGLTVTDWRIGGGQNTRNCLSVVLGAPRPVKASARSFAKSTTAAKFVGVGIGVNSPQSPLPWYLDGSQVQTPGYIDSIGGYASAVAEWMGELGIGFHELFWLESGDATDCLTFYGIASQLGGRIPYLITTGMTGEVTM